MAHADRFQPEGLILAGGQGRRLGGRDKGLMPWQGQPVTAHLSQLLRPLVIRLLISCNRHQAVYARWADQLLADSVTGFPGPMAGLLAGLSVCRGSHLLVLPCDLPRLDRPLLQTLLAQARAHPERPVVVRCDGQWQPLLTVLPCCLLPHLAAAWDAGERSPRAWLAGQDPVFVDVLADDERLLNANLPAHWAVDSER